jgi:hypothetical protein
MEELNYHKLINLKKRLVKYNCDYSKKIMATIDECIVNAKAVSKKKDEDRRLAYQFEDVTCEICGNVYPRGYFYKHRRDKHGKVGKPKKEVDPAEIVAKYLAEADEEDVEI